MDLFREKLSRTFSSLKGAITVERSALPSNEPENRRGWPDSGQPGYIVLSTTGRGHRETFFMTLEASTASS